MKSLLLILFIPLSVNGVCDWHKYSCSNGNCVDPTKKCDGINDCGDYSDENSRADCRAECPNGNFRCSNGKCIDRAFRCDGQADCDDLSDESSAAGCNLPQQYKCHVCSSSSLLKGICLDPFNGSDVTYCQHGCHKIKTVINGVVTVRRQCLPLGSRATCASTRADSLFGSGQLFSCGCLGDFCNSGYRLMPFSGVKMASLFLLPAWNLSRIF